MSVIRIDRFQSTPLITDPFEHCVVRDFVAGADLERIEADFPQIDDGGSYPLDVLTYGPAFQELVDDLLSDQMREAFSEQFGIDLTGRPATLTIRGRARPRDGKIHLDSKTKMITVLLYLNRNWSSDGGCLRLLRSPDNIEDVISEIPPEAGTLVAFRCRENAWHGHKPFDGVRRSMQLNWVVDESAAGRSDRRHRLSSWWKRLRKAG